MNFSKHRIQEFLINNDLTFRKFIIAAALAIIYLILSEPINEFLKRFFVCPILIYARPGILLDVLFSVLLIAVLWITVRRELDEYVVSPFWLLILVSINVIYIHNRIAPNPYWTFYEWSFFPFIKYFDLLTVFTFFGLVILWRNNIYNPDRTLPYNIKSFVADEYASFGENDVLNRQKVAESLAEYISNTHSSQAFAVGIVGEWGSGKTTFIRFLRNSFSEEGWIKIQFNPWYNERPEQVAKEFFHVFEMQLGKYSSDIPNRLNRYSKEIVSTNSHYFTKSITSLISLFTGNITVEDQYNEINGAIKKLDKRILVTIDDLDRLDKKEVTEVLRIVRNTANFSNVVFVVAYDKDYVVQAVKEINPYSPEKYCEKIFQFELLMPPPDPSKLKAMLLDNLKKRFKAENHIHLDKAVYNVEDVEKYLTSLRDVIRFTNSFAFDFEQLQDRLVFEEFFRLELLKYKYPKIYILLYNNHKDFLDEIPDGYGGAVYRLKETEDNVKK